MSAGWLLCTSYRRSAQLWACLWETSKTSSLKHSNTGTLLIPGKIWMSLIQKVHKRDTNTIPQISARCFNHIYFGTWPQYNILLYDLNNLSRSKISFFYSNFCVLMLAVIPCLTKHLQIQWFWQCLGNVVKILHTAQCL